jgi:hypothetical protein
LLICELMSNSSETQGNQQGQDLEGVIFIENYLTITEASIKFATSETTSKQIKEILTYAKDKNLIKYKKGENKTSPILIGESEIENYLGEKLKPKISEQVANKEETQELKTLREANGKLLETLRETQGQNKELIDLLKMKEETLQNQQKINFTLQNNNETLNLKLLEEKKPKNWLFSLLASIFNSKRKKPPNDN